MPVYLPFSGEDLYGLYFDSNKREPGYVALRIGLFSRGILGIFVEDRVVYIHGLHLPDCAGAYFFRLFVNL
jgi:hypothetical protein